MPGPLAICHRLADAAYDSWHEVKGRAGLHEKVGMGADGTPTSRLDKLVEEGVLEAAADLAVSVVSEEAGFVDHGSDVVAVVDPVDGTRNAARGIPFFCTSIAVGRNDLGGLEAGVVRHMISGERFAAARGEGATLDGASIRARPFSPDEVVVAFIADETKGGTVPTAKAASIHLRDMGSAALEMCLVATGALDAFFVRQRWLRVVDIAAGAVIVEEAGGVVTGADRSPLTVPLEVTARTGIFAAGSRETLEVLE